ncbi:FAD-binding monooxygenase [Streptomyces viridochromogenes]|uniref:FAD-binding monooxygenase n=1 Tax=Streptomyces viridochromogenes TaxID=1938 RepID=A0A0J7ZPL4_STRVR|nr:FAD-dependent monooxygenase [Streptomyces viridochromogenes]KMS77332.1 FAD-binding monooxygenase [Streptomyces viridochromogenes]KOG19055.1 FAD-binding monooxygenase [Streptomyces viridochromogenes]KOG19294.1 FAD-binding monooxygenase [Streptomyces viridochromogenes]
MTDDHITDVCVIGAGPAGLALSLLLLSSGVRVTVLERSSDFRREFRGEILQPGGLAVLDSLGVLASVRERGSRAHSGFRLVDGDRTLLDIDYRRLGPPYDHLLAVNQRFVLEELLAACRRYPSFRHLGGHRLVRLLRQGDRFTGAVAQSGTERRCSVHADVLVGADGRYSKTRRLAGIDQHRMDVFDQDVVWFRLRAPGAAVDRVRVHRSAGQAFLVHASHPDVVQIGWTVPHGTWGAIAARGIGAVREDVARALPGYAPLVRGQLARMSDLTLLDVFAGRAETWVRDGLVLLGDAAHTHSPLGAQGINLALQDAAVLHPVLLDALGDGPADARALERFTDLRSADVGAVFRFQVAQSKAMLGRPGPVADMVRPALARLVQRTPLGTFLTRRIAHGRTPVRVRTDLFTTTLHPKARP